MPSKKNPPTVAVQLAPDFAHAMLTLINNLKADAQVAKDDGSAGPIVSPADIEGFSVLGSAINAALVDFLRGPKVRR